MTRWFAVPVGTADSGSEGTGEGQVFPLEAGYGLIAASGVPEAFAGSGTFDAGVIFAARVWVPGGRAITSAWAAVRTSGTYTIGSPNQLGVYDDAGVQLATTTDDPTLWAAVGWRGGELVGGPILGDIARFVYVLIIATGFTGVSLPFAPAGSQEGWFVTGLAGGNRRAMFQPAGALPALFNPVGYGTATSFLPQVGLS